MWASSLACNGILSLGNKFEAWSCHGIGHELSAYHDMSHGVSLAIVTPRWMRYILSETTAGRLAKFGTKVWGLKPQMDQMELAEKAIGKLEEFFAALGLPKTLTEAGVGDEHFGEMAENAVEHGYLSMSYVPLAKEDVEKILSMCL